MLASPGANTYVHPHFRFTTARRGAQAPTSEPREVTRSIRLFTTGGEGQRSRWRASAASLVTSLRSWIGSPVSAFALPYTLPPYLHSAIVTDRGEFWIKGCTGYLDRQDCSGHLYRRHAGDEGAPGCRRLAHSLYRSRRPAFRRSAEPGAVRRRCPREPPLS